MALVGILLVAVPAPAQAKYRDGAAAYAQGDYVRAYREFKKSARRGHGWSQIKLGDMYRKGEGVERDVAEAAIWYHLAAEQGNPDAQVKLGDLYRRGEDFPRDAAEAVMWYRRAAEQGNRWGQIKLGDMYYRGEGVPQDIAVAEALYRRTAKKGDRQDQLRPSAFEDSATAASTRPSQGKTTVNIAAVSPSEATKVKPRKGRLSEETGIAPTPIRASADSGIHLQLAAYRVPGRARQAWKRLRESHEHLLGNLKPSVLRVDFGSEMGVFFRLVAGPLPSESVAQRICILLAEEGTDCLVSEK